MSSSANADTASDAAMVEGRNSAAFVVAGRGRVLVLLYGPEEEEEELLRDDVCGVGRLGVSCWEKRRRGEVRRVKAFNIYDTLYMCEMRVEEGRWGGGIGCVI